jgi:hypothetical protein
MRHGAPSCPAGVGRIRVATEPEVRPHDREAVPNPVSATGIGGDECNVPSQAWRLLPTCGHRTWRIGVAFS